MTRFLGILLMAAVSTGAARAAVEARILHELPILEVYEAILLHGGKLYAGHSRVAEGEKHQVVVFDAKTETLLGRIALEHTVSYLQEYDGSAVIAVGKSQWPWRTHYTVITPQGKSFATRTVTFPENIQVDKVTGSRSDLFFTLLGENSLLRLRGNQQQLLAKGAISGPGYLAWTGKYVYAIENNNVMAAGDENLVRINPVDGSVSRTFDSHRAYLSQLLWVPGAKRIAVSETLANQVLWIDPETNQEVGAVEIPGGYPRGLATLDRCLVVASEDSRVLSFVHFEKGLVAEWDLSHLGPRFQKARRVVVDQTTGKVFARSTYLCSGCQETMSSIAVAGDPSGETRARCQ